MLQTEQKTFSVVKYGAIEELLSSIFGRAIEICWLSNGYYKELTVAPLKPGGYEEGEFAQQRNRIATEPISKYVGLGFEEHEAGTLLDGLCSLGHIEPGDYLIEVSW